MNIEFNLPVNLDLINDKKYFSSLVKHLNILKAFHWDGVVLNVTINTNNIAKLSKYSQDFPKLVDMLKKAINSKDVELDFELKVTEKENSLSSKTKEFKIYTRYTIQTNIKNYFLFFKNNRKKEFKFLDVLAAEPLEKSHLAYLVGSTEVDLISLTRVTSIVFLRKQVLLGCSRGIMFEISYHKALENQSSFYSFFSKFSSAIKATKGQRYMVLSNGTVNLRYIRAPFDVSNIAQLFGLDVSIGKKMISEHCLKVLNHSENVRKTVKGVLKITSKMFINQDDNESNIMKDEGSDFKNKRNIKEITKEQ